MTVHLQTLLIRASALAGAGLMAASLAFAQAVPPTPPPTDPPSTGNSPTGGTRSPASSGSPVGGSNIDTAEGQTPDSTRPGVSASAAPRLGASGTTPSTTRSRPSDNRRTPGTTTARGFTPQGRDVEDRDTDATNDARSTTRSARDEADDFRDEARETTRDAQDTARDAGRTARDTAEDFRDAARETTRDARDEADDFRDTARDTFRDAREDARDTRRDARDTADDFRDAARDESRDTREDFRDARDERDDRFDSRERDGRFSREDDRFDSRARDERMMDRDDRSRTSVNARTSADFRVSDIRSPDIGLWFDRWSDDGLVINDIGSGVISRWGFREGDRIYSVNGIRVDSERQFIDTLFDDRWRDQRASVIIYRHGRPWTVYMYPSQLISEYTTVVPDPLQQYGLVLDDRYDDYVVVWRVLPRTPAFYAGLRPGDVISTWDGRRLSGRDEFVRLIGRGDLDSVVLDINRNRQPRRIDFDLGGVGVRTGARTSLRPDLDARGQIDGRFDGTLDGRIETSPDGRFDVEGRGADVPVPSRLRGSASGEIRGSAGGALRGTVQPGTTIQPGIVQPGTVQPMQPDVRIQGGVRGGGLFRGNR